MPDHVTGLEVVPGVGLEGARFGEARSTHRERRGEYQSFERSPGAGMTDLYTDDLVMLSYDETDRLNFVEIGGSAVVTMNGTTLTGRPLADVLEDLRRGGFEVAFDGDSSFVIASAGVELFTSDPGDLNEPAESVSLNPIPRE
jgi:hypothetical protein